MLYGFLFVWYEEENTAKYGPVVDAVLFLRRISFRYAFLMKNATALLFVLFFAIVAEDGQNDAGGQDDTDDGHTSRLLDVADYIADKGHGKQVLAAEIFRCGGNTVGNVVIVALCFHTVRCDVDDAVSYETAGFSLIGDDVVQFDVIIVGVGVDKADRACVDHRFHRAGHGNVRFDAEEAGDAGENDTGNDGVENYIADSFENCFGCVHE